MSDKASQRKSEKASQRQSEPAEKRVNGGAPAPLAWLRQHAGAAAVIAGLILFPYIFALLSGTPVGQGAAKFWQGQLIVMFIMAVYAMSYDLLLGYTGILSFGHAAFFGGGAYAMALFLTHVAPKVTGNYRIMVGSVNITDFLMVVSGFLLALVVAVLLGLLFSAVSSRVKGAYFAMITLAMGQALYILSKATDFVKWTGADEGLHGVPVPVWLNPTQFRLRFYFVALAFMLLMYFVTHRIVNSPTGRVFVAIRENESRVRMIGYNPAVYRSIAFTTAAVIAGLAGALYALWTMSATPTMTAMNLTINALIMSMLGGMGTLIGPMLGAGLMEFLGHFFYQWFGARWPLVFGVLFILLVLFLPYGIVGTWQLRRLELRQGWKRLLRLLKPED
ncbi:MAG TPA: branched-chain amino acid ABC transporter permease [Anaerolineae bacterium]|nr:branched-chain amino acid ABC transporter permease [Anaerolineae bacterium]HQM14021.1 branched-chain amino acid ABC transporter permease [Anaerolineae bacterium]